MHTHVVGIEPEPPVRVALIALTTAHQSEFIRLRHLRGTGHALEHLNDVMHAWIRVRLIVIMNDKKLNNKEKILLKDPLQLRVKINTMTT